MTDVVCNPVGAVGTVPGCAGISSHMNCPDTSAESFIDKTGEEPAVTFWAHREIAPEPPETASNPQVTFHADPPLVGQRVCAGGVGNDPEAFHAVINATAL